MVCTPNDHRSLTSMPLANPLMSRSFSLLAQLFKGEMLYCKSVESPRLPVMPS